MNQLLVFTLVTYDSIIINNHNNSYKHYFYLFLVTYSQQCVAQRCKGHLQRNRILFSFSFILSLHLCFFVGRCSFLPPRKKMNLVGFFSPGDYLTYICYTVYIHNVYKHYKQYIYYTYIFVHIPRISSRWLACHLSFSICLSIAFVYLSFFLFSPENITKIYA